MKKEFQVGDKVRVVGGATGAGSFNHSDHVSGALYLINREAVVLEVKQLFGTTRIRLKVRLSDNGMESGKSCWIDTRQVTHRIRKKAA